MARILVNYTYNKSKDEYKILSGDVVFADMKVAVLETENEINIPLVVPINNQMTVVDRASYELVHKQFHLISDEKGIVSEHPNGMGIWLPKDTDVSKLRFLNGQLVLVEETPVEEKEVHPKKSKAKTEA